MADTGRKDEMGETHMVPLSTQAVAILHELHPLTGSGRYVFSSIRMPQAHERKHRDRCPAPSGLYRDEMTGHGSRSMASTLLHEQGWASDARCTARWSEHVS